jgi:hypothetical protein
MPPLWERLARAGLLKAGAKSVTGAPAAAGPSAHELLRLCDGGALDGGLSVALDVRPDEAFGPLCAAIGGRAHDIRVVDVRDRPRWEILIRLGGLEARWEVEDVAALAHHLNVLLEDDLVARAVAILGDWGDALQLWCVPKPKLSALLRADYFAPRNRNQLEALAAP